jgi:hypothetical protein
MEYVKQKQQYYNDTNNTHEKIKVQNYLKLISCGMKNEIVQLRPNSHKLGCERRRQQQPKDSWERCVEYLEMGK